MNGGMIGEAICIGVSDRRWCPIAARRGGVLARGWRGGSAVFRVCGALASGGCRGSMGAVGRQRNLGLVFY